MDTYELVRRSVLVSGMSERAAAREFGLNRRTVAKMVDEPVPAGYQLSKARKKPKLGPFLSRIEEILLGDESAPCKQRHQSKRIYERLRDEEGYLGCESQVRKAVAGLRLRSREVFVPLVSLPGEAQADFFESWVEIAGVRRKAHAFLMILPCTGVWFARAYPAENSESFCDGNSAAFGFFGGVPTRIVYDNPAYAVHRGSGPMKGRDRVLTGAFGELVSTFLFEPVFAAPRKGNEKGAVERRVGLLRSSLMVPVPSAGSFAELNSMFDARALGNKQRCDVFTQDALALLPLREYMSCRLVACKADKLSLIRFDGSSYSVPTNYALRPLLVRATPFGVEILSSKRVVATHERSLEKGRVVTDLAHYVDLLMRKPRAARTALPVLQAGLPDAFEAYRRRVEDGTGHGDRQFVAILALRVQYGSEVVAAALRAAATMGLKDPADVRLLVLKDTETPHQILCTNWKLPQGRKAPTVERAPLSQYTSLLTGGAA